jgi:hypothetical protein
MRNEMENESGRYGHGSDKIFGFASTGKGPEVQPVDSNLFVFFMQCGLRAVVARRPQSGLARA